MRVHIVTPDWTSDHILARLTRHLMEGNGWSVGKAPDPLVDLNIFMPYLEWRKTHWDKTPTLAWFTHREDTVPGKAKFWDEAAQHINVLATPATRYARELGRAAHIPHPVELDKFVVAERPTNARPTIGVSGMVYPGGRKGEHMIARLAEEQPGWLIFAAGRGWPVETVYYDWLSMERFYQSLDVFLCTSLIEGGPVTMLEALACGVPVVVPSGVGEVDDLPDHAGIVRYPAGDYAAMLDALSRALALQVEPQALRALVEERTVERWCAQWLYLAGVTIEATATTGECAGSGQRGLFCVAYGERARACATEMMRTVRAHNPGLPIAVVSDTPLDGADVMIIEPQTDSGGRDQKLRAYELAPQNWEQVLYLDVDTLCVGSLSPLFDRLSQGYEMVFTASPEEYATVNKSYRKDRIVEFEETLGRLGIRELLQPSGGMWAFRRCPGAARFMANWRREWDRYQRADQLAMMRALYGSPVRYAWMGTEWNYYAHHGETERGIGVLHFPTAARAWGSDDHPGYRLWQEWRERA